MGCLRLRRAIVSDCHWLDPPANNVRVFVSDLLRIGAAVGNRVDDTRALSTIQTQFTTLDTSEHRVGALIMH